MPAPIIAVLGASGLIGHAIALDLVRRGFAVRACARHFTAAQAHALDGHAIETPLVSLSDDELMRLLAGVDIVVNCVGVLQDAPGSDTDAVHRVFAARLCAPGRLLVHLSVPGAAASDRTDFSRSKRAAEQAIAGSGVPFVILRPGFVVAPAAYGGSALIRALAALPLRLPPRESCAPFAAIALSDICETVTRIAARRQAGETGWGKTWDLMETRPGTVGDVVAAFRAHGGGPVPRLGLPGWLLTLGAWAGDAASRLGWKPPVRTTALAEMRRGVTGDPGPWTADTGIAPLSLDAALAAVPATVQEKWFARLYLLKALMLTSLVVFWCVSGLIALTVAFVPARAILLAHGFSMPLAHAVTIGSSCMDVSVGLAIAWRRSCRAGLWAGVAVSLFYMAGAAVMAPDLWAEPLGALVKTLPAIVLMLACLAVLEER